MSEATRYWYVVFFPSSCVSYSSFAPAIGRLCEKCDGKWYVVQSAQRPIDTDRLLLALFVIPTYAPRPLSESVTNATLALTVDGASSAVHLVRQGIRYVAIVY